MTADTATTTGDGATGDGATGNGATGYFDSATTAPPHPAGEAAQRAAAEQAWADPDRPYGAGRRARLLLEAARESIADSLRVRADEVSFCGSGTEAVRLAVLGTAAARHRAGSLLLHSAVEHSSVLRAAAEHTDHGGTVATVGVDHHGRVLVADFAAAARGGGVAAAVLQSANHEVGTLQPVAEVAAACAEAGVPLVVDAAASAGWAPLPAGWSVLAASAHKWGGPPGVGVLVVRTGTRWRRPGGAGDRDRGRGSGFPAVSAAVGAAAALRAATAELDQQGPRLRALIETIRTRVAREVPEVEVLGDPDHRLPHLVTFSCLYVEGEALLTELDRHGFAVASGSACASASHQPSHVLAAMGAITHGNVRVSLHRGTTGEEVERFLTVLPEVVARLRRGAGVECG